MSTDITANAEDHGQAQRRRLVDVLKNVISELDRWKGMVIDADMADDEDYEDSDDIKEAKALIEDISND